MNADGLLHTFNAAPARHLVDVRVEDDVRDALQAAQARQPSLKQRRDLLDADARVGVDIVFVGFPAASENEAHACAQLTGYLAAHHPSVEPVLMSRALTRDIELIADIQQASAADITADLYVSTSPLRAHVERWRTEEMIDQLVRVAQRADKLGLRWRAAFEDSTRTPPADLRRAVERMSAAGARTIVVNDTVGDCVPTGAADHVALVRQAIGEDHVVDVVWHGHNDKGLALANALAAADAGANVISGTFTGLGERTGNIPLEQMIYHLAQAGSARYDLRALADACQLLRQATGIQPPADLPLVGADAFSTSTGTHAAALVKARAAGPDFEALICSAVDARTLGRVQTVQIGPNSGRRGAQAVLEKAGLAATEEAVEAVLQRAGATGRALTEAEIRTAVHANPADLRAPIYPELDDRINGPSDSHVGIQVLVAPTPYRLRRPAGPISSARHAVLQSFQRTVVDLWLDRSLPTSIAQVPTWSAPAPSSFDVLDRDVLVPTFFRTDEAEDGRIFEIQAPGSWWGTHQALEEQFATDRPTIAERFARDVHAMFPDGARVLHLFESSLNPHENRFFAQRVRQAEPAVQFWGIDPGLSTEHCNFVRAHSYSALVAEDLFRLRINDMENGRMRFDLPPIPLFDQKVAMCLPYHPLTADRFTDAHRALFPYTALLGADAVRLPCGTELPLAEFSYLRPEERRYFLKYAGADTTRNFGSRGVFSLRERTQDQVASLMESVTRDHAAGEPWILQADARSVGDVTYIDPEGHMATETMTLKFSSMYGPSGLMGRLLLADPAAEVHWTRSSVVSLVEQD